MYVPHERRALILRLLEQRGYLRTAELARELGVTEETIRTDFIALHERKLLLRVHGGAHFVPPHGGEEDATRLDYQLICRLQAHLSAGMVVYVDPCRFAASLLGHLGELACTVLTPSPRQLLQLSAQAIPQQVIIPGGALNKECQLIESSDTAAFFRQHKPDIALLFPQALPAPGLLAYRNRLRAAWAAAAAQAADRTLLATPAHTFYAQAPHRLPCRPHLLITEDNLPAGYEDIPTELVPYISAADLQQEDDLALH